jgi:hypothetical protein
LTGGSSPSDPTIFEQLVSNYDNAQLILNIEIMPILAKFFIRN